MPDLVEEDEVLQRGERDPEVVGRDLRVLARDHAEHQRCERQVEVDRVGLRVEERPRLGARDRDRDVCGKLQRLAERGRDLAELALLDQPDEDLLVRRLRRHVGDEELAVLGAADVVPSGGPGRADRENRHYEEACDGACTSHSAQYRGRTGRSVVQPGRVPSHPTSATTPRMISAAPSTAAAITAVRAPFRAIQSLSRSTAWLCPRRSDHVADQR